ncbi:MAG: UV DNA damage repair endonuclease UvsE [Thermomicrobiales bacterium]
MKIGYPCINRTLNVSASRTFRLASYSSDRLRSTIRGNLEGLQTILEWNVERGINFFRISSETIPFASHPVMNVDWQNEFCSELAAIGSYIRKHDVRINVHPGQYTLLSSPRPDVHQRSIAELVYHAELFDLLALDRTNVIQIHVGGVYGDRAATISTVISRIAELPDNVRNRLAIENDEHHYPLADCLFIARQSDLPVLLDVFHQSILNSGESIQ